MQDKPRLPRIERTDDYHVEDETAHLWAVSYADFLMVLLSFFILFFSVSDQDKNNVIQQILAASKKQGVSGKGSGGGTVLGAAGGEISRGPQGMTKLSAKALQEALANLDLQSRQEGKSLILLFPDDVYKKGSLDLEPEAEAKLASLIDLLTPFMNEIDLTIVGHTDSKPLYISKRELLTDNFDLSVLRATRAVQFAIRKGVSPEVLSAKGSAETRRNTRSLSVVIRARSTDQI